jgi:hypothetical protein
MTATEEFDDFTARLREMRDEDVLKAWKFEGGDGARADIIAAEVKRRRLQA